MSITATVTADSGPDIATVAKVFSGVGQIVIDPDRGTITLVYPDQTTRCFSLNGVTTFTATISGTLWTVTVS